MNLIVNLKMTDLIYFRDEEFKRATPACSLSDMDEEFMSLLDFARHGSGVPFIINSAYRTVEYEKSKGRSGTSQHCKGRAVDIRCVTNADRYRILFGLYCAGFRRIGIGSNFIHVDSGYPEATDPLIWLY